MYDWPSRSQSTPLVRLKGNDSLRPARLSIQITPYVGTEDLGVRSNAKHEPMVCSESKEIDNKPLTSDLAVSETSNDAGWKGMFGFIFKLGGLSCWRIRALREAPWLSRVLCLAWGSRDTLMNIRIVFN